MKILSNSFAVFWNTGKNDGVQFMADMFKFHPEETARDIAERHARLFPDDRILSVRDGTGRFQPFKPSKREAAALVAELNRYRHG